MMEKYAERFDQLGKKFVKKLKEFDTDAEIEIFHLIGLFALDVICGMCSCGGWRVSVNSSKLWNFFFVETVMGVSINAMSKPDSDYIQAIIE